MHPINPEPAIPTPCNGYIPFQVIIHYIRETGDGTLFNDSSGSPILDYGNNNSQIVNGVRPALSNENGLGAITNNEILKSRTYISMNGYLKINLLPQLNFKSNIFYERASLDDFRYTHNKYGAASSVQGRVSQDRDFFHHFKCHTNP